MNYIVIDVIIFLLGCAASFCFIRLGPKWLQAALGLKLLEGEASRARARQELKDGLQDEEKGL